jgi:hypothetical protein
LRTFILLDFVVLAFQVQIGLCYDYSVITVSILFWNCYADHFRKGKFQGGNATLTDDFICRFLRESSGGE